jgi:hypothetical protein
MRPVFIALSLLGATACGKKDPAPGAVAEVVTAHHHEAGAAPHEHGAAGHDHGGAPANDKPHDHGAADHAHKAPHGGEVQSIGVYHVEAVPTKVGLLFFPLDADEKELPLDGVSGKLTFVADGKEPVELALEPMGNHLHAMVVLDGAWKAVVNLTIKGEARSARFEGTGLRTSGMAKVPDDHGHEHGEGHHDHGAGGHDHAAEMPAMQLSDKVESVVEAPDVAPGRATTLAIRFEQKASREAVTDFEVSHEKKLHLFVVREDMSFFAHEHPEPVDPAKGTWSLPFTFPAPGRYRVYSDFKSTALGASVTVSTVVVPGAAPAPTPLVADTTMTKVFDGLKVTLTTTPATLGVGDAILQYTLEDAATGTPVTDLQPYLGAMAHLFILHEDLTSMAHAHPRGPEVTAESRGGPKVELHAALPKAGLYKLWGQFQRDGKVITTEWTLQAK